MTEEEEILLLEEITSLSYDDPKFVELTQKLPISIEFALSTKNVLGAEFIENCGFNFELIEAKYGKDWYTKEINL